MILAALDAIGKFVPALRLRATEEEEALGIDDVEIGEFAVSRALTARVYTCMVLLEKLGLTSLVRLRGAHARDQDARRGRRCR